MQTQFETCVTAFIALDFKLRWEKLSGWDLRRFPCSKAIFNDSTQTLRCCDLPGLKHGGWINRPTGKYKKLYT